MKKVKKTNKEEKKECLCPYCEVELAVVSCPFCEICGAVFSYCVSCQTTVLDKKATECPKCGGPLKKGAKK